jgi:hypothetical protein
MPDADLEGSLLKHSEEWEGALKEYSIEAVSIRREK